MGREREFSDDWRLTKGKVMGLSVEEGKRRREEVSEAFMEWRVEISFHITLFNISSFRSSRTWKRFNEVISRPAVMKVDSAESESERSKVWRWFRKVVREGSVGGGRPEGR